MFSKFSEDAQKVLVLAKKEMLDLKHPYVGSEHLLLAVLSKKELDITKKLEKEKITYSLFKDEIIKIIGIGSDENKWFLYTPLLKRLIETATLDAKDNNSKEVTVEHLFLALLEEGEGIAIRILLGMKVNLDNLYQIFSNDFAPKKSKKSKKLLLDEFGVNFTKKASNNEIDPVVGREEEINRVIEILSRRTKNNPLLIGEAGVGKSAIVEELCNRIVMGNIPKSLLNKQVISLSMSSLVAGTKYRGEFEERIGKILKEVEDNDNIILFIDEIHTLVGAGGAEGAIDASNILKPSLARGKIKLIGATTTLEYKQCIEQDRALSRRFQTVFVEEPTLDKVMSIMQKLAPIYEGYHGVKISDDVLSFLVESADRYVYDRKQPDKTIDILDEVCAKSSLLKTEEESLLDNLNRDLLLVMKDKNNAVVNQDFKKASKYKMEQQKLESQINEMELLQLKKNDIKIVSKEMISEVIHLKTKIPIYELNKSLVDELTNIEEYLNSKVLGQSNVIKRLCNITKRVKLGLKKEERPKSFLLVGSTGIGKTLLVKEFANKLYGKDNFIRLDMSEFKESHTVSKIIGSPPGYIGYNDYRNVLEDVRNHPHSIILLDEVEKAHPDILNLFLQILDEGKIKDSKGQEVRFDHTFIFMTSNLGCHNKEVGFHNDVKIDTFSVVKDYFSLELINRIDDIFLFNKLDKDIMIDIVGKELENLKANFKTKKISLTFTDNLINEIIKESEFEKFGARKVGKVIADKLDTLIIDKYLSGKTKIIVDTLS